MEDDKTKQKTYYMFILFQDNYAYFNILVLNLL